MSPEEIAQKLLRDLQPRFNKLTRAEGGPADEEGQIWLFIATAKKLGCEAKFQADTHYDRIFRSFQGWAEANAKKLGVKKIYVDARDGDDEDIAA